MKTPKGQALILAIVLVAVISTAAAGYLYFQNQQLKLKPEELSKVDNTPVPTKSMLSPSPNLTQPPAAPTDETANWKTYKNTKYGFTLKYPEQLSLEQNYLPESQSSVSISGAIDKTGSRFIIIVGYTRGISQTATGMDAFESCSTDEECFIKYYDDITKFPRKGLKNTFANINGKSAKGFEFVDENSNSNNKNQYHLYYPLSLNGKFFLIAFNFVNYTSDEITEKTGLVNQVLSTLKFN